MHESVKNNERFGATENRGRVQLAFYFIYAGTRQINIEVGRRTEGFHPKQPPRKQAPRRRVKTPSGSAQKPSKETSREELFLASRNLCTKNISPHEPKAACTFDFERILTRLEEPVSQRNLHFQRKVWSIAKG
jgi:hypothetical protein